MTGRRKGTPCACETDPCSCGSSKGKCIRAINNVSPDPNGDFNLKAGAGISIEQTGDDEITIVNNSDPDAFLAGDNIEFIENGDGTKTIKLADIIDHNGDISQTGDLSMTGDLSVNGNIVQNGAYYDTHAEHIYTRDDYIIMRDGAISALAAGDYSGFQVKLYDGVNDGRLVIDNTGTARVGDVGDEQPLLTREESDNLNNGALLKWDGINFKAVDEGTVGDDIHPIKIVNGVATPVIGSTVRYARIDIGSMSAGSISSSNTNMPLSENADPTNIVSVSGNTITIAEAGIYLIFIEFQVGEVGSSYFVSSGFYNSANSRIFYSGDDGCLWDHHINYSGLFLCNANESFTVKISGSNVSSLVCRDGTITLLKLL